MDAFTNNFKPTQTAGKIKIHLITQLLEEFTCEPVTLVDHLRRRRIELVLYQKDVAVRLGVTTSTVGIGEKADRSLNALYHLSLTFLGIPPPSNRMICQKTGPVQTGQWT